jgi:hypothetical protein
MPALNVHTSYGDELKFFDGVVLDGVLFELDADNVETGRSCAMRCVVGSVADSSLADSAAFTGFAPGSTVITCERVDQVSDLQPEAGFAIVVGLDRWAIVSVIERLPGPKFDCVVTTAAKRGKPGVFA